MSLFRSLSLPPSPRLVAQLGTNIVRQCYPQLRGTVGPIVLCMPPAEARGYVQALTGDVVRRTVDETIRRYELDPRTRLPLVASVVDGVLARVLADLAAHSTSSPAVRRRAA